MDKETRPSTYISDEVKNAIIANGGIPIAILPPDQGVHSIKTQVDYKLSPADMETLVAQIKLCNGIILQGGWDSFHHEIAVARYCYENNIPLLGICAGHSNVIKALGGSIKPCNPKIHLQTENLDGYAHDITILPNTLFHKIIGKTKMQVNSSHHNHADIVPPELVPSAFDPDGHPEVVESPTHKFFMAMKFHPECLAPRDPNHNAIFASFIKACL